MRLAHEALAAPLPQGALPLLPREGVDTIKGLDWFKVNSDIQWDGELERVSDAAFRTFIELISLSCYDLSDGKVPVDRARRYCNTPHFDDAIDELSRADLVQKTDSVLTVKRYKKHQQTRREVASKRAKARDRVTRYRSVTDSEVTEQSKSKSKSKKEEGSIVAPPPVDNLVELATTELPQSQSTPDDFKRTIDRYRGKLNDQHIEQIICQLGAWPKAVEKSKLHLTLASWLNKEPVDPLPPSHVPFEPDEDSLKRLEEMAGLVKGME